jgi:hypothetical protein
MPNARSNTEKEEFKMRFITAGESHGPELTAIIEGLPAGLPLSSFSSLCFRQSTLLVSQVFYHAECPK